MKARAYVVDHNFFNTDINELKIRVPSDQTRPQWWKTFIDILSDLMQTEIGDYVFFWVNASPEAPSHFRGIYRIISNPFIEHGEDFIIKIKIEQAYNFSNGVTEYEIINSPNSKDLLWNIIGKKTGGKSRASTPLSKYETEYLIHSLIDKNPNYQYHSFNAQNIITNLDNELSNFNFGTGVNDNEFQNIILNNLIHRNGEHFRYEKSMELLFNWILKTRNKTLCNQLNIDVSKLSWFANYLPYGIERSEIDYMVMLSEDICNDSECKVIEFQAGNIDEDHLRRVLLYSKWVKENIFRGKQIVTPVVVCKGLSRNTRFLQNDSTENIELYRKMELYRYDFVGDNSIRFTRLLSE